MKDNFKLTDDTLLDELFDWLYDESCNHKLNKTRKICNILYRFRHLTFSQFIDKIESKNSLIGFGRVTKIKFYKLVDDIHKYTMERDRDNILPPNIYGVQPETTVTKQMTILWKFTDHISMSLSNQLESFIISIINNGCTITQVVPILENGYTSSAIIIYTNNI